MQKQKVSPFMFVLCVLAIKSALGNYVAPSSSSSLVIPSFSPLSHTQMQILLNDFYCGAKRMGGLI